MPDNTILDKILTQKHAEEIRSFNPISVVNDLLREIDERDRTVMIMRFGLSENNESATLEEIGQLLDITRERVRQIIKVVSTNLRKIQLSHEEIQRFTRIAEQLLQSFGGVLEKNFFITELFELSEASKKEEALKRRAIANLNFLLNCVINEAIEHRLETNIRRSIYAIPGVNDAWLISVIYEFTSIIQSAGEPISEADLIKKFKEKKIYAEQRRILIDEPVRVGREFFRTGIGADMAASRDEEQRVLRAYISASRALEQNAFEEWGIASWASVHPKRMNDKIYLVLKHSGKPLHFSEITQIVNNAKFDHKIAKSPSVHNELILDKRFVLVGRGIYALKEWGFQRGTVAEVIADILQDGVLMSKEQIIEAVMEKRFVKKQTINLALMNRSQFTKNNDGQYSTANPKS